MKHLASLLIVVGIAASAQSAEEPAEITFTSTADGSTQPARLYLPTSTRAAVPLLVLLHTWSGDYHQNDQLKTALPECQKRAWALVMPNFRGANNNPAAGGSELAVRDILDCVAFVRKNNHVDSRRIYLVGASGGGHLSLLMAGRAPDLWAGVSAWVPISDLAAWHADCVKSKRSYWKNLEAMCGGAPGASPEVDQQYKLRSPMTHLPAARGLPIDINAGIHDGHTGSVPIRHSLRAFNLLAEVNDHPQSKLTDEQIEYMTERRMVPAALEAEKIDEPDREHPVLFRRAAGPARITIFNGGHEGDMPAALRWLAEQSKK